VAARGGRGDQLVVMQVLVPKKTTKRQEELLKELGEIEAAAGEQKTFFDRLKGMF
jgi:DnaJ-class molecular chaperone